mmetsp:Transcript_27291/g.33290  ORF Transcript_27291/g.33290 Transcript_27291/m.33290 type:complete len:259 (-) Transcript_27291:52-828(-)
MGNKVVGNKINNTKCNLATEIKISNNDNDMTSILNDDNIDIYCEYIVCGYTRNNIYITPNNIVCIICKYFGKISLSNIINDMYEWNNFVSTISNELKCNTMKLTKLYEAKIDGYEPKIFHDKCDNKGATLCIVKNNYDYIFGGYTSKSWESQKYGKWGNDTKAFIYGIKPKLYIAKLIKTEADFAVYYHQNYTIDFGRYGDVALSYINKNRKLGAGWKPNKPTFNYNNNNDLVCYNQPECSTALFEITNYEVFAVQLE